jgi:hypothetical protein
MVTAQVGTYAGVEKKIFATGEMSNVFQFPEAEEREFRRGVMVVERFLRVYLKDGPRVAAKVRYASRAVSRNRAHFNEARRRIGIQTALSSNSGAWYWCLPGDVWKTRGFLRAGMDPAIRRALEAEFAKNGHHWGRKPANEGNPPGGAA